jgi:hypothetical protein
MGSGNKNAASGGLGTLVQVTPRSMVRMMRDSAKAG